MAKSYIVLLTLSVVVLGGSECFAGDGFAATFVKEYGSSIADASFRGGGGGKDPIVGIFVFGAGALAYAAYNNLSFKIRSLNEQAKQFKIYQDQADSQLSENDFTSIEPHGYDLKGVSSPSVEISRSKPPLSNTPIPAYKMEILEQLKKNNELSQSVHAKILNNK